MVSPPVAEEIATTPEFRRRSKGTWIFPTSKKGASEEAVKRTVQSRFVFACP
jgi:hypothetical protein